MKLLRTVALSSALAIAPAGVYAALDKTGSDWVATVAQNYIDAGPASDSLSMVDFLLCVTESSNSGDHVNETYGSMVDENICNGKDGSIPAFASQVMTTSRTSNTEPYEINSWFTTDSGKFVVVDSTITSAPTVATPRGVATLTWNMVDNNGASIGAGGYLKLNADNTLKYVEKSPNEDTGVVLVSYVHGTLDGNGTSGKLRVQIQDWTTMVGKEPTDRVYQYVFNADSAHYKTDSITATCLDRSAMTTRVYGYKLFTEAGALVSLTGPFGFDHTDPQDTTEKRGWADKYRVWRQGGESGTARPLDFTRHSNNKDYAVCWDDNDDSLDDRDTTACGAANDGVRYEMTHATEGVYAFQAPIEMVAANITDELTSDPVTPDVAWVNKHSGRQFAKYRGGATSFDFPWQCLVGSDWTDDVDNACDGIQEWSPEFVLKDGFEFQQQGTGTQYYVKAVDTKQSLAAHSNVSSCADLALSTAPAELASYTVPDITGTVIWGTAGVGVPSIANSGLTEALKMKVIHGVEQ